MFFNYIVSLFVLHTHTERERERERERPGDRHWLPVDKKFKTVVNAIEVQQPVPTAVAKKQNAGLGFRI